MKSEYRSILAIALSVAVLIIWYTFISPPKKGEVSPAPQALNEEAKPISQGDQTKTEKTPLPPEGTKIADPQAKLPIKTWTIRNGDVEVELSNDGAVATSWKILGYRQGTDPKSPLIDLATTATGVPPPLALSFLEANFGLPERPRFDLVAADESSATFRWRSPEMELTKKISLGEAGYLADVSVEVKNPTTKPLTARASLIWGGLTKTTKGGGFLDFLRQPSPDIKNPVYYVGGKVNREANLTKTQGGVDKEGMVLWSGIESRYFLSAVVPRVQGEGVSLKFGVTDAQEAGHGVWAGAALPSVTTTPGEVTGFKFSVYAGPKEIVELKKPGVRLEDAIDYGWFSVVAIPILYLLKFFYGVIHNYGVAIIILTIFVKLLLHPINVKSLKSMKEMQKLQPRLKELQAKFKDDKQRLNQETMGLFRSHKVNPMGGCLPMLLQLPIYIALYKVLWNSIELYHAPFFWFYRDLSAPDPYFITPILLGVFMVAQQRLMPSTSADPVQQKMMMLMPVMFSAFMLFLPVGLVVYILVNTVMSVTQQWMYNKGIGFMEIIKGGWKRP